MSTNFQITCRNCKTIHDCTRDTDAPKTAIAMKCNWCPKCEGQLQYDYKEWYVFAKKEPKKKVVNQLGLNI